MLKKLWQRLPIDAKFKIGGIGGLVFIALLIIMAFMGSTESAMNAIQQNAITADECFVVITNAGQQSVVEFDDGNKKQPISFIDLKTKANITLSCVKLYFNTTPSPTEVEVAINEEKINYTISSSTEQALTFLPEFDIAENSTISIKFESFLEIQFITIHFDKAQEEVVALC